MRKHMNKLSVRDLTHYAPFYAWDCVTLNLKERGDVYLIIRNEKIMTMFLKLLIYELKTIDGKRGTAEKLIKKGVRGFMAQHGYVDEHKQKDYEHMTRHQIMTRVWFTYSMARVKLKLSFSAFIRGQTLFELWGHQIIVTFRFLRDTNQIECPENGDDERKYFQIIKNSISDFCIK